MGGTARPAKCLRPAACSLPPQPYPNIGTLRATLPPPGPARTSGWNRSRAAAHSRLHTSWGVYAAASSVYAFRAARMKLYE